MATDPTADDAKALVVVGWTLLGVSCAIISLRLYARLSRVRRVAVDDYLMLASWLSELLHMVFITVAWKKGLGRHFATLSQAQQQAALFYTIGLVELFSVITCMWGRLSFAAFLLYIIGPSDVKKRFALQSVIVVQIIINLIVVIQIYAQCGKHVTALWDYAVAAHATCQSPVVETIIGYVQSGLNSLCDVTLTVLPAMILWNLNMPRSQKIGLGAMLTLSIFAFAASLAKAVQIRNLSAKNDFTWYMVDLQLWVCIENNVVMVAASIPALRPLLRKRNGSSGEPSPYTYSGETRRKVSHDPYSRPKDQLVSSGRGSGADGNSEEYILESVPVQGEQITKRVDVQVAYESRSEAQTAEKESQKHDGAPYRAF